MKTIQKQLILAGLLLGLFCSGKVSAQEEQTPAATHTTFSNDVGLRLGEYTGIAFRHFDYGGWHVANGFDSGFVAEEYNFTAACGCFLKI